jgi:hypothetical protein
MNEYNEMIYGWYYIISLRREYPEKRIFVAKYDYSDAYSQMNHTASAAAQSIAIFGKIAYVAL